MNGQQLIAIAAALAHPYSLSSTAPRAVLPRHW
jgi:hypothetical protein